MDMVEVDTIVEGLRGFNAVQVLHESTYRDGSTAIVTPTRKTIHWKVVRAWMDMVKPLNQYCVRLLCQGAEVGDAYNKMIEAVLGDPQLSKCKYLLTLEDDNIIPADAHLQLLDDIQGYDAVGLLYARKKDSVPLLVGDPAISCYDGSIRQPGKGLVEVNILPMGCTLYRMDLFREMPKPWFQTIQNVLVEDEGRLLQEHRMTQDVSFSLKARSLGKRFAINCDIRVGHIDVETGIIY